MFWSINNGSTNSTLCWWNRWCYKNRTTIKNALTSICNRWSVFRESGKKFFPSETRLQIFDFSETESRRYSRYSTNGKSEGTPWMLFPLYTGVIPSIYVPTTGFKLMALRNIRLEEAMLSRGPVLQWNKHPTQFNPKK